MCDEDLNLFDYYPPGTLGLLDLFSHVTGLRPW